jgi:hypothetical protein
MADRQRWFWGSVRFLNRSPWTFFGTFALLTIMAGVIADLVAYRSGASGWPRRPADLIILLAVTTVFSIVFWFGMAAWSAVGRRREGPRAAEELAEQMAGLKPLTHKVFIPPRLWWFLVIGVASGALLLAGGESTWVSLSTGASWVLFWALLRWMWPTTRAPTWKLVTGAVAWAALASLIEYSTRSDGQSRSLGHAILHGAQWGMFTLVVFLLLRRFLAPGRHPGVLGALRVRDRASALAADAIPTRKAALELLQVAEGKRASIEVARDLLRRRPFDEPTERAIALIDQAIDTAD